MQPQQCCMEWSIVYMLYMAVVYLQRYKLINGKRPRELSSQSVSQSMVHIQARIHHHCRRGEKHINRNTCFTPHTLHTLYHCLHLQAAIFLLLFLLLLSHFVKVVVVALKCSQRSTYILHHHHKHTLILMRQTQSHNSQQLAVERIGIVLMPMQIVVV